MTAVKTAKTYTLEELKEKAGLALNVPALVEIAKTAPLENGKINLTQVRDKAYQHVVEQTHDLKDAKKLADSTRALAMLRREFVEEFNRLISSSKIDKEKLQLKDIEVYLPLSTMMVTHTNDTPYNVETKVIFPVTKIYNTSPNNLMGESLPVYDNAEIFCIEILKKLSTTEAFGSKEYETAYGKPAYKDLRDLFVQFFEEKFGLKVKVCWYCKFASKERRRGNNGLICYRGIQGHPYEDLQEAENSPLLSFDDSCEHWSPKKISEKPSST